MPSRLLTSVALLAALAAAPGVAAAQTFAGDGRFFSGIAGDNGEGLIVPQTLRAGAVETGQLSFEAGAFGSMAVVAGARDGLGDVGLAPFADASPEASRAGAFLAAEPGRWGLVPYVGASIVSAPPGRGVFQGMDRLLPLEGSTLRVEGVAGLAYQLLPGVGAGIEYRVAGEAADGAAALAPSAGDQTIMMRLDLGF